MSLSSSLSVDDVRKFLKCSTLTQTLLCSSSSFGLYENIVMPMRHFKFQGCLSVTLSDQLAIQTLPSASLDLKSTIASL